MAKIRTGEMLSKAAQKMKGKKRKPKRNGKAIFPQWANQVRILNKVF